jgi:beta-glucanase (GH16 family)
MSDVKDEIDWEWPGVETTEVQSNYFFLGYANYSATKGETHKDFSDTSSNFHTYTLDWQAETLQWIVDGNVIRTLQKSDTAVTLEDGTVQYQYPSTPSRIQISIWPAGTDANGEGTVTWAGGMIDWSDADFAANGYFHNTVRSISVSCADDAPAEIQGYTYAGNDTSMIPIVTFTNHSTIVGGASPTKGGVSFAGVLAVVALPSLLMLF